MDELPPDHERLLEAARAQAVEELWRRGLLGYKRHSTQRLIKEAVDASSHSSHFLLCSRRLGKSYELLLEAFETAIQIAGSRILYLAPWAKNASEITEDAAVQILADCPKELLPEFKSQVKEFHFKNGSIIRVKGVNGEHAQYLRGGAADLVILDEIGLMHDLRHVISDVVMPMTMTTNGRILLATTPARSPGHESTAIYWEHYELGASSRFTIRDAPHVSDERKAYFLRVAGEKNERIPAILHGELLPETTTAKREYFCEFVTDADSAVLPRFPEAKADIVKIPERPPYFDTYVSMDPGFNDKTGILFAYVDYLNRKLVIEDELLLKRADTPMIARALKEKEKENWGDKIPCKRITDIDLRLIADLWSIHGLSFHKADKPDMLSGINMINVMIDSRQIIIHPKCEQLIQQMENAVYDAKGKDFDHTEADSHFDLVAALKYLCRAINWQKNPYPDWWNRPGYGTWVPPKSRPKLNTGILGNTPFARRLVRNKCGRCGRIYGQCFCRR